MSLKLGANGTEERDRLDAAGFVLPFEVCLPTGREETARVEAFARAAAGWPDGDREAGEDIDPVARHAGLRHLRRTFEAHLAGYPTSAEEDVALLDFYAATEGELGDGQDVEYARLATEFRLREKRVLGKLLDSVSAAERELDGGQEPEEGGSSGEQDPSRERSEL